MYVPIVFHCASQMEYMALRLGSTSWEVSILSLNPTEFLRSETSGGIRK
jgi:hypothetical protein